MTVWRFDEPDGAARAEATLLDLQKSAADPALWGLVCSPGTSALFLLSNDAVVDRVHDALEGVDARPVSTNLSREEEAKLREVFDG